MKHKLLKIASIIIFGLGALLFIFSSSIPTSASEARFILRSLFSDDGREETDNSATSTTKGTSPTPYFVGLPLVSTTGTSTVGADADESADSRKFSTANASKVRFNFTLVASSSATIYQYAFEGSMNGVDFYPLESKFTSSSSGAGLTSTSTMYSVGLGQRGISGQTTSTSTWSHVVDPIGMNFVRVINRTAGASGMIHILATVDMPQ